jgi:L-ascorbate metabolism protein UlaG (beta-lactamase superfamily)
MCCTITLINHATVLLKVGEVHLITDPVYSYTISLFIPRLKRPGIAFHILPPIDLILISHSDYDHLNFRTLRRLRRRDAPTIVFPKGLRRYGIRTGFKKIVELEYWEEKILGAVRVTCVPARHSGTRMLIDKRPACGYVIQSDDSTVYFSGDTGYGEFFKEIGTRFSIDLALLPIGAYKPYDWFKEIHLNPYSALQAFLDLKAKHLIPIHWGTFKISDEPIKEPPILLMQEAERRRVNERIHVLDNGESFVF